MALMLTLPAHVTLFLLAGSVGAMEIKWHAQGDTAKRHQVVLEYVAQLTPRQHGDSLCATMLSSMPSLDPGTHVTSC